MIRLDLLVALIALAASRPVAMTQETVRVEGKVPEVCQTQIADGVILFDVSGTATARIDQQSSKARSIRRLEILSGDYSNGQFNGPLTRVRSSLGRSGQFRF